MVELKNRRVLLIQTQGIGNTILTLPLFKALKNRQCVVHAVLSGNGSSEIVQLMGLTNKVYVWNEQKSAFLNISRIGFALRSEFYDAAFAVCPAGKRENVLLRIAKSRFKRGWRSDFSGKLWGFKDSKMPFWDERRHDLFSNGILTGIPEAELLTCFEELQTAFGREIPAGSPPRLGLQLFSKDTARCWSEEKFEKLLKQLTAQTNLELVFFGSLAEESKIAAFSSRLGIPSRILCGKSWKEVAGELKRLHFFLGVDSSVSHFAAAAGIPTCVLFAFTNPERTCPPGRNVLAVQTNYPCGPCYRFAKGYFQDCEYHLRCIKDLSVRDVLKGVQEHFFSKNPDSLKTIPLFGGGRHMLVSGETAP